MGRTCIVPGCTKRSAQGSNISFHRFPLRQAEKLRMWLEAIGLVDVNLASHHRICSEHFRPSDFYLIHPSKKKVMKDRAVPSLNLIHSNSPKKHVTKSRPYTKMELPSTSLTSKNGVHLTFNGNMKYEESSRDSESSIFYSSMPLMGDEEDEEREEDEEEEEEEEEAEEEEEEESMGNDPTTLVNLQKERVRRQMRQEALLFERQMRILREEMEGKSKEREIESIKRELKIQLVQMQLEKAQLELEEAKIKMYRYRNSNTARVKQEVIDDDQFISDHPLLAIDVQIDESSRGLEPNGDTEESAVNPLNDNKE